MPINYIQNTADDAVLTAKKQLQNSMQARSRRFSEIEKNYAMYYGWNPRPSLQGRFNVPFDVTVMQGYIDTLLSKVDEELNIKYNNDLQKDLQGSKKLTALYKKLSGPDKGMWSHKDILAKRLGALGGRAYYKKFTTSSPKFKDVLSIPDPQDMVTEPQGGFDLDSHLYKGQINIFKTRAALVEAGQSGLYDRRQTNKLINAKVQGKLSKDRDDEEEGKISRYHMMGIDVEQASFIGEEQFKIAEWVMFFKGKWWYMVWSTEANMWLRFQPLEEVFAVAKEFEGRGPWITWGFNEDAQVFDTLGPADYVRPIAATMKIVLNLQLENLQKRNWDMKAYDPNIFRDASELIYRRDGLARATLKHGQTLSQGIHQFETPEIGTITINLFDYLNQFIGEKTGITPGAQGRGDEKTATVHVSNLEQVADRLGLSNKMYQQAHIRIGQNFKYGMFEHTPEKTAVKLLGINGVEWDDFRKEDAEPEYSIEITGTTAEQQANDIMQSKREKAIDNLVARPEIAASINPKWLTEQILQMGEYKDEEIKAAFNRDDSSDDLLSAAALAIYKIIDGEEPKPVRSATMVFVQFIHDYAQDNYDVAEGEELEEKDQQEFMKIMAYAEYHIPIAQQNAERKATLEGTAPIDPMTGQPAQQNPQGLPQQTGASAGNNQVTNTPSI